MKEYRMVHHLEEFYDTLHTYYAAKDLEAIEGYLSWCEQEMTGKPRNQGILLSVYNEQGSFYRSTSRYHDSLAAFTKAQKAISEYLGRESLEYATLINNMAGTYRLARHYDQAIRLFKEAIEIYEHLGQQHTYAYASVHNNLSLAYQETGQISKAVKHLELALEEIQMMPDHRSEMAVTYSNLTALYHEAGDDGTAMRCLNRALEIFEENGTVANAHYAAALNSLGGFLYASGEYERAIETYEKAARHTHRFFGKNLDYGISCQNMYWVYLKMEKWDQAIQALMDAAETYAAIFGPEHERTKVVRNELKRIQETVTR
ncbi:tetratricopeptide repeat protein [Eubacterium barkeri]|nr:DUF2225 domain-containing protein [Eubacterium barkeri]